MDGVFVSILTVILYYIAFQSVITGETEYIGSLCTVSFFLLAALCLCCDTSDLLVVIHKLLIVACGI